MEQNIDLKSRTLMLALEMLAKRLGVDAIVLIRWLEGMATPPAHVLKRLQTETSDVSPFYYQVVDDPLQSPGGIRLQAALNSVTDQLTRLADWWTPVGVRKRKEGYGLVNKFGEVVSPYAETPETLRCYLSGFRQTHDSELPPAID